MTVDEKLEDKLKYCGLWGEYLHHSNNGRLAEFWRRFGGLINLELAECKGDTK